MRFSLIFFASGFAGLIYESIWTHYLKLFLGHAAYAQTLVLGIFMGGMAIGAALAGRTTSRLPRPLLTYAAIEAGIGLLALAFHPVFTWSTGAFYDVAMGGVSPAVLVVAKWGLAVLLILPASILLGATFPLFTAAVTRSDPAATGRWIATLYFVNSLGGAVGVLASGFLLIPALDLPGTIVLAGSINLLVAAAAAGVARQAAAAAAPAPVPAPSARGAGVPLLLVLAAFVTGASSFVYEVGWIRMLSLVLGSATHSFELMLCAFILGLALGGLWVRRHIDRTANPGLLLGYVQLAMGAAAIATLPLYNLTFDLAAAVLPKLPKTDAGYAAFNALRYGISLLVMLPASFCAGMTLPLATRILYREEGQGERAIGIIYSANTLGAIAGLAAAVHVGLPVLGLEYLVASGALVDIALGAVLLAVFAGRRRIAVGIGAVLASTAATGFAAAAFEPQKLVSGVFRTGKIRTPAEVIEIAHGRTATVSVERDQRVMNIRTNGKPDAAAEVQGGPAYTMDEVTMTLLGAVPLMLHEAPRTIANIGFGSGMTTARILMDPRVQRVDTIEIEPKMVELARHFGRLNEATYSDPRSVIHIDDAKSFFASHGQTYDVIVSEPSNPWVSGVSGLFSAEFYRHVSRYLRPDGLFVQWMHVYESHPDRVASVMRAMGEAFEDYLVLGLNEADLLLVARPRGSVTLPAGAFARLAPPLQQALRRLQVATHADIALRIAGNKALFQPWLAARGVPVNSDFAPYLDTHADRDRFMGTHWREGATLGFSPYLLAEAMRARPALSGTEVASVSPHWGADANVATARLAKDLLLGLDPGEQGTPVPAGVPSAVVQRVRQHLHDCREPPNGDKAFALAGFGLNVLPYLSVEHGAAVLEGAQALACFRDLPPAAGEWPQLLRLVARREHVAAGAAAERLLEQGQGATLARFRYLLGLAVAGRIAAGDRAGARATWARHERALGPQPLNLGLDILRVHASTKPP